MFASSNRTSTPFGALSQAFGNSTPSFGASPAPAFGSTTSPFGGSFGTSTPQSSLFGSTTQQSQHPFGNSSFGSSTPFGASSTSVFGASNTSAFSASSTPAFGASSTPAFGASNTSAFGASSTPAFGASSTSVFGASNTSAFGALSTPALSASNTFPFGSSNTNAFGASTTPFAAWSSPAFGASPAQAFGSSGAVFINNSFGCGGGVGGSNTSTFAAPSTPTFGASKTAAFGVSSTPSFSFGSSPAFGQSTSAFGSRSFASTQSPFGAQDAQASTPNFGGQSTSGVQQGGSRVMPYAPTTEADSDTGKLQSISAMSVYKEKNHEELRWEDYKQGDKGGKFPVGRSPGGAGFGVPNPQPSIFSPSPTFGRPTANPENPFSSSIATNSSAQKTPTIFPSFSLSFGQKTAPSIFWSTTPSNTTSGFGSPPGFATTTSQPFGLPPSHGSTPAFSTGGNFNNSYSSPLFNSNSSFGQNTTPVFVGQATSACGQTNDLITPGYCKRVKDFVVGRNGYGSIKFLGETDVSRLDPEMSVRLATREVNVYMDDSKKPPVGQGLNEPAVTTLLNIKCVDKKSGTQVKDGERLDKFKEKLKKKAEEVGAKFVSYDAVSGECLLSYSC